jgi:3-carboxy-cis,cis-muconate cycloisomerase
MSDLLWPGDHRCGELFSDAAVLAALVGVESAWLRALVRHGVAPAEAGTDLAGRAGPEDLDRLAAAAESGGNPVIPLVALLRERAGTPAADWVHKGLTSQDVLDTALAMCLRDAVARLRVDIVVQVRALARLAGEHRGTPMAGRTLTQHAVPITFGVKAAGWLDDVLDAYDRLDVPPAARFGGAAGTLAGPAALAGSARGALALAAAAADELGLDHRPRPVTAIGDGLVACTDAWGRIANDVLLASRPEIGELSEEHGGGSSTMPQKRNPVLSVLIRRAALAAPPLGATLHAAAAARVDERPDGAWHVEWATLRTLARRAVTAGAQAADLLAGLRVHPDRMAATLAAARPGIDAEQRGFTGDADGPYRGATDAIIDAALQRAAGVLG